MEPKALSEADRRRLDDCFAQLRAAVASYVGYPVNAAFDYAPLLRFMRFPLNNVGDPFGASAARVNTHEFEREVVGEFAELTHAPPEDVWGYVTTGGTEGNMYGLFLARELYPDGIVYYSEESHYSVVKVLRLLRMPGVVVRCQPDGSVDLDDLRTQAKAHREVPAIVVANIGATMTGAIDDVSDVCSVMRDLAIERYYVHADAALAGMILPFVDDPPQWDFRAGVDSLAISGHKMIGAPVPCGVVLARRANVQRIARPVEYVGSLDATISGSRSGIAPLFLWFAFRTLGVEGFRGLVRGCLATAAYAVEKLGAAGVRPWRCPYSVTVVFERPAASVVSKWQLAVRGDCARLVAMPHVTRVQIDQLAADLVRGEW